MHKQQPATQPDDGRNGPEHSERNNGSQSNRIGTTVTARLNRARGKWQFTWEDRTLMKRWKFLLEAWSDAGFGTQKRIAIGEYRTGRRRKVNNQCTQNNLDWNGNIFCCCCSKFSSANSGSFYKCVLFRLPTGTNGEVIFRCYYYCCIFFYVCLIRDKLMLKRKTRWCQLSSQHHFQCYKKGTRWRRNEPYPHLNDLICKSSSTLNDWMIVAGTTTSFECWGGLIQYIIIVFVIVIVHKWNNWLEFSVHYM